MNARNYTYTWATVVLNVVHGAVLIGAGIILAVDSGSEKLNLLLSLGGGHPIIYLLAYLLLGVFSLGLALSCIKLAGMAYLVSALLGCSLVVSAAVLYALGAVSFDPIDILEIPVDLLIIFTGVQSYRILTAAR